VEWGETGRPYAETVTRGLTPKIRTTPNPEKMHAVPKGENR